MMKKIPISFSTLFILLFIFSAFAHAGPPSKLGLPTSWDWREHNGTTPVKDQSACGSCWAFATVGTVESAIRINDNVTVNISEQHLVSCNTELWGCDGGWIAFPYYKNQMDKCSLIGTVQESCFPYTHQDDPCDCCPCNRIYELTGWGYIAGNWSTIPTNEQIKDSVYYNGPNLAAVDTHNWDLLSFVDGVVNEQNYSNDYQGINHAIVIVGWDDDFHGSGQGVWIIKNSWGTWWQDGGYGYVKYGTGQIGQAASWVQYNGSGGALDCENAITLAPNTPYAGTTTGGPSSVSSYNCMGWDESGPEIVHKINVAKSGQDITVTLSNLSVDLDVFILSACDPTNCVAYGDITATYTNAPAGIYYIVVDGYMGESGSYTLTTNALFSPPRKSLPFLVPLLLSD